MCTVPSTGMAVQGQVQYDGSAPAVLDMTLQQRKDLLVQQLEDSGNDPLVFEYLWPQIMALAFLILQRAEMISDPGTRHRIQALCVPGNSKSARAEFPANDARAARERAKRPLSEYLKGTGKLRVPQRRGA